MYYINLDTGVVAENLRELIHEFVSDIINFHFVSFRWEKVKA